MTRNFLHPSDDLMIFLSSSFYVMGSCDIKNEGLQSYLWFKFTQEMKWNIKLGEISSIYREPFLPMKMRRLNLKVKFTDSDQVLVGLEVDMNLTFRFNLRIFIGTKRYAIYTSYIKIDSPIEFTLDMRFG